MVYDRQFGFHVRFSHEMKQVICKAAIKVDEGVIV